MANKVTRKFTNASTGAPILSGVYELRSVTNPGSPAIAMTEIVTAVEADQGLYQTAAGVEPGVYKVYKSLVDTGEEITVSPGRMAMAGDTDVLTQNAVAAVFHATAFIPEADLQPSIAAVNAAITAATAAGAKKVFLGGYRNSFLWTGAAQVTIPDGITLDLGGAELRCTIADTPPIVIPAAANVAVKNGKITGTATTGTSRMATAGDTTAMSYWENIQFAGFNTTKPTVGTSADAETRAFFSGCANVILANPSASTNRVRKQSATGPRAAPLVPGGASSRIPITEANATGDEVGNLFRTLTEALGAAPSTAAPFANHTDAAEAVKQMWFTKVPALEGDVVGLQDQIDAGAAGSTSWSWSRSVAADAVWEVTPVGGSGTVGVPSIRTCYQNAYVRGTGNNAVLVLQCAAVFKVLLSAGVPFMGISGSITIDLAAFEAALAVKYPGWGISGIASLRYSEGGRAFGFYFKKAFKAFALESYLVANRMPWSQIPLLDGDGDGPSALKFCSSTAPFVQKGVKFTIPPQSIAIGSTIAAVSFELEIPATQTNVHANDGALGTIIDLPYLL